VSGRCPQRGYWSSPLLQAYYTRDLFSLSVEAWGIFTTCYLLNYIGFCRPYYSYRQLTLGEYNRILKLQEVYATYFEDLYDKYFPEEDLRDLEYELVARGGERRGGGSGRQAPHRRSQSVGVGGGGGGGGEEKRRSVSVYDKVPGGEGDEEEGYAAASGAGGLGSIGGGGGSSRQFKAR